jgi:hypothetical protein
MVPGVSSNLILAAVGVLLIAAAFFIIVRSLRLPPSFYRNEEERSARRMAMLERAFEERERAAGEGSKSAVRAPVATDDRNPADGKVGAA